MPNPDKDSQAGSRKSESTFSPYNHGQELLISALMPQGSVQESVRFLENNSEVHKWVDFDDEVYGHGVITYDLLYGWWSRYRKGAIALFRDDRISALLALWPLEPSAFG